MAEVKRVSEACTEVVQSWPARIPKKKSCDTRGAWLCT